MSTSVAELAQIVNGEVHGDGARLIQGALPIDQAGPYDLTYAADEANARKLKHSRAGAVVVSRGVLGSLSPDAAPPAWIVVDEAQSAFIDILVQLRPQRKAPSIGLSSQAYISAAAKLGDHCNVYPGAYISDDVVIGDNCDIYPGVFIAPDCRLGNNVTLFPNVVVYHGVSIGDRVMIHANAVLGADGFGYRFQDGCFHKIPHVGGVQIHDDVEIGACTTIDRGMMVDTIVGTGTKLDNLVMIAHNCSVGRHNAFASQVGLAGSVSTGDYVRCGGQVGIGDHVHLGEGCSLGGSSGVHKDIPAGQVYIGTPAAPEAEQKRIVMALKRLPELRKQVREMQARLNELVSQVQPVASDAPPQ